MAHKKGQGSTRNGRDSNPQYRGIKLYGGESAQAGSIIVRQSGTKFLPGFNVRRAGDDTLFSTSEGRVVYIGRRVHVDPLTEEASRPQALRDYRTKQAAAQN